MLTLLLALTDVWTMFSLNGCGFFSYIVVWLDGQSIFPLFLTNVLVLAGVELVFFIVASIGLCFRFVLESVLIIQGCFG